MKNAISKGSIRTSSETEKAYQRRGNQTPVACFFLPFLVSVRHSALGVLSEAWVSLGGGGGGVESWRRAGVVVGWRGDARKALKKKSDGCKIRFDWSMAR